MSSLHQIELRRALMMSLSASLVLSCLVVLALCGRTAGKSCRKSCQSPLVLYSTNCVCVPSFVQCSRRDDKDCAAVVKAKFCNTPSYMVSCAHSCGLCRSDYVRSSKLAIAFFRSGKSALGIYQGNCGPVPLLTNGACRATHGKFSDVATCVCNPGYTISGHGLSHCQKDKTWSAHATSCIIKNCGSPPVVARAIVSAPVTTFGATATYTCNVGFRFRGPHISVCRSDGSWAPMGRSCTIKNCGTPPAVVHTSVVASETTYGSTATYRCDRGYTVRSGSTTISCQANGKWTATTLKCSYFVYMGDWILAMRIVSGNRKSSYSTWFNKRLVYDAPISSKLPAGCLTGNASLPCSTHFRSVLVNNWNKIGLSKVAVHIMKSGRMVKKLEFNGAGSSTSNWFSKHRLLSSSWNDLTSKTSMNYFSIRGPRSYRRWYINKNWGGCNRDRGWLVIKDSGSHSCKYDKGTSYPRIGYSDSSREKPSYKYVFADTMLILVKLTKDVCGPPPSVKRATVDYYSLAVGTEAIYRCQPGFEPTNWPSVQCLSDSTWAKVGFSCEPNSCLSVSKGCNVRKDGEYWIYPTILRGKKIKVFCHKMTSSSPREYITLKKRNYGYYPNTRNEDCKGKDDPLPKKNNKSGTTTYSKVRLNVHTLSIIRNDRTFATSTSKHYLNFGEALACHSKRPSCRKKGVTVVDFRGTGLTLKPVRIFPIGSYSGGRYYHSFTKEVYKLSCGGFCGGCFMGLVVRMRWLYNPSSRSATKPAC